MLFFEACYRSLCMFIYYCHHSTSVRLFKWFWKAWGLTSTGLMSCFNLQKTTGNGSSWVTFPTLFQQRVSDSSWKTACLGWEEEAICMLTPSVLDLSVDNIQRCPFWQLQGQSHFVIGTHIQAEIINSFHLSCWAAIRKLAPSGCLNSYSGFELVAFWWQALISYYQFPGHPAPLNTCGLKKTITYKCKWLWSAKW